MAKEWGRVSVRVIVGLAVLVIAPPLITTLYLWGSRTAQLYSAATDYAALVLSVAAGVMGVLIFPIGRNWKLAIAIPYAGICFFALVLWTFTYVCGTFGTCF